MLLELFFERKVRVGLLDTVAPGHQHGVVTLKQPTGPNVQMGLFVDRPDWLQKPDKEMLSDMFDQVDRIKGHAVHIEVHMNGTRRVYAQGSAEPILTERL